MAKGRMVFCCFAQALCIQFSVVANEAFNNTQTFLFHCEGLLIVSLGGHKAGEDIEPLCIVFTLFSVYLLSDAERNGRVPDGLVHVFYV